MTVYLEEVETSWLLISLHDRESFIIKRTGVCVWMTAKTSSQNINSRKTVVLQLESSWVVEELMFFGSLYEKWYLFFQEYLRMLHKTSTSSKKGEIFRIILQKFLSITRGRRHCFFFFLLTLKSAVLWDANHSAKKRRETFGTRLLDLKLRKTVLKTTFKLIFG